MSAASDASQSRLSWPAAVSTSSEEPTFTTMRRKSLSDGVFDMVPAERVNGARCLARPYPSVMAELARQDECLRGSLMTAKAHFAPTFANFSA